MIDLDKVSSKVSAKTTLLGRASLEGALTPSTRSDARDLEVKDAPIIFHSVWQDLEKAFKVEHLIFPREIHWLNGAPGAGKETHTQTLMRYRDLDEGPIVVSDLLESPEAKRRKNMGMMVGDREVTSLVFKELLKERYDSGIVVDGYPRTHVQVACVKLLYEKLKSLRAESMDKEGGSIYPRSQFHLIVLFIDENESIRRQIDRGKKVLRHNESISASGVGHKKEVRMTDLDPVAARRRYHTFKDQTYEALKSLSEVFQYHYVDAHGTVEEVRKRVIAELKYQSSLKLEEKTFDLVSVLPLADMIGQHARQELVKRSDHYQRKHPQLFAKIVDLIAAKFVPIIQRHTISGYAIINSESDIFEDPLSTAVFLDVFFERGYNVTVDIRKEQVPDSINLKTGKITPREKRITTVHVHFNPSQLRHH